MRRVKTAILLMGFLGCAIVVVCKCVKSAQLVDEVVAEIDGEAITLFEVVRFWRIEQLFAGYNWRVEPTYKMLGKTLITYINRKLLLAEMDRLGFEGGSVDLQQLKQSFQSKFHNVEEMKLFLKTVDATKEEILRMMVRQEILFKFLKRRAAIYVVIQQKEIDEELQRITHGQNLTESERKRLKIIAENKLKRRKFKEMVENWLKDLYRRHKVKIIARWAPEPFSEEHGGAF